MQTKKSISNSHSSVFLSVQVLLIKVVNFLGYHFISHSIQMACPTLSSSFYFVLILGAAVAQWLRCCATNRKVVGSIPSGVNGFLIDIKFFRSHYGPGVDSASNRNEYRSISSVTLHVHTCSGRNRIIPLM